MTRQPREKPHPVDERAERQLLAYLWDPEGRADLLAAAGPGDFVGALDGTYSARGRVWHAWQSVAAEHTAIGANDVLVRDWLRQHDPKSDESLAALDQSTGTDQLNLDPDPLGTGRMKLAEIVRRLARQRGLIVECEQALLRLYNRELDPDEEVARLRERLQASDSVRTSERKRRPYILLTDEEAEACRPAEGIVGDILFEDSLAYLYGPKDSWKSFTAVGWACAIATGKLWLGRKTKPGLVVYVCAEGARGIGQRIAAWKRRHGISSSIDVLVLPMPVNLLDPSAVPQLIATIDEHHRTQGRKPALIVFDTLARSMDGGDENDTPHANAVTAAAGLLKATYGACVLIVHHSGYSAPDRMRGNSALAANADIVLRIIAPAVADGERRKPGSIVTLHCKHAKETEPFEDIKLTTAEKRWVDKEDRPHNSLVLIAPDAEQIAAEVKGVRRATLALTANQQKGLTSLFAADDGLTAADWKRASGLAGSSFYEVRKALVDMEVVDEWPDDKYRVTDDGRTLCEALDLDKHADHSNDRVEHSNGVEYTAPSPLHSTA
jgi:hypothetical protein